MESAIVWRTSPMRTRLTFSRRITLAFVIMTIAISGTFTLGIVGTVLFVEYQLFSDEMGRESEIILHDSPTAENAAKNSDPEFSGNKSLPAPSQDDDKERDDLNTDDPSLAFSNLLDRSSLNQGAPGGNFSSDNRIFYYALLGGFASCLLSAWLIGLYMAKRIMAPVTILARDVRNLDLREPQATPLLNHYTTDEIGQLAMAFDATFEQLRQSLEREQLFTSDVSHELRTPLMVIATSYELLRESSLSPIQKKQIERIGRSAAEMRELVQTFLLLARDKTDVTVVGGRVTLEEAAHDMADFWGERIRNKGLEFSLIGQAKNTTRFDRTLLGTVISNLLRNAKHYTERGSVQLILENKGFRVEDSGVGINEAEMATLFEPFVRGPRARGEGLGLGLSLVKRICAHQGWEIEVTKLETGGSCFRVQLSTNKG